MSALRRVRAVVRRELLELLRDRRTLLSAFVIALLGPLTLAGTQTVMLKWRRSDKALVIAVQGRERAPELVNFLQRAGAQIEEAPADPETAVGKGERPVVLRIPEGFGEKFRAGRPDPIEVIRNSSETSAHLTVERLQRLLGAWSGQVAAQRLVLRGVSPELLQPLTVRDRDVATPEQRAAMLLQVIPMFLLISCFVGAGSVAADMTAGERERGALEPLLLNPVTPWELTLGKWLACTAIGLGAVTIALVGFTVALAFLPLEQLGVRGRFGPAEAALTLACLIPAAALGSAVNLAVSLATRSVKEAQTNLGFVNLLPMLPGMVQLFGTPADLKWSWLVPVVNQTLFIGETMRGHLDLEGPLVVGMVTTSLATFLFLARVKQLFGSEAVVFGRSE